MKFSSNPFPFSSVKNSLASTPTLALYDASCQTKLSKPTAKTWWPMVPCRLCLKSYESYRTALCPNWDESISITWASERFSDYLIGLKFHVEVDHKPLVSLLSAKKPDELPARVQHFRVCMMQSSKSISHITGKNLYTTNTLSVLSIRFQIGGDIVKVDGTAPLHWRGVWELPRPPLGVQGQSPIEGPGGEAPGSKMNLTYWNWQKLPFLREIIVVHFLKRT